MIKLQIRKWFTYFFMVVIIASILFIPMHYLFMQFKSSMETEFGRKAMSVAITTAEFIEEDINDYKLLVVIDDYETEVYDTVYYEKMNALLRRIREETNVSYLYTIKKISETELVYIFDGEDPTSEFFSKIGDTDNFGVGDQEVFINKEPVANGLETDPNWGTYVSGYAPIIDPITGDMLGAVGVDISEEQFQTFVNKIRLLVYISTVFLILVASVAVVYLMKLRIKAAEIDFLTGLSSKEAFEKLLKTTIQNAKKSQSNLSLLMIDIDNFKELNDHYGHLYGDEILKKVAQVMQDSIRKHDLSFRFGGDEFAIILPGINRDFAKIVANRIIREVNEIHQTVGSKDELSIHISIGISEWEEGISFIELIQKADKALYTAKTSGKNQVQLSE